MVSKRTALQKFSLKEARGIVTSNGENQFEKVWAQFLSAYSGGQPVAVYSDYESDFRAKFTFTVGVKQEAQEGEKNFGGGEYEVFHLDDKSKLLDCWQYVWQSGINRAYTADFEFYNQDGSVDVFIAVKPPVKSCEGFESRCGIECGKCEFKEKTGCKGCLQITKPFWGESCPVKSCCEQKGHSHCGLCTDFACGKLNDFSYDEKQGDNGKRIENCKRWRQNGVL